MWFFSRRCTDWKDEIEKRGYRSIHLPTLGVEAKMLHIENGNYNGVHHSSHDNDHGKNKLAILCGGKIYSDHSTDIQIIEIENE